MLFITKYCLLRNSKVITNNNKDLISENFTNLNLLLKAIYKKYDIKYTKYFKMDNLCRLAFLTSEILLMNSGITERYSKDRIGIYIDNSASSLDTDINYAATISDKNNYFPSPAIFVYTLPNIMLGEICIRHGIKGENSLYVSEHFEPEHLVSIIEESFESGRTDACIGGWVDCLEDKYDAFMFVVESSDSIEGKSVELSGKVLSEIYNSNN